MIEEIIVWPEKRGREIEVVDAIAAMVELTASVKVREAARAERFWVSWRGV